MYRGAGLVLFLVTGILGAITESEAILRAGFGVLALVSMLYLATLVGVHVTRHAPSDDVYRT